MNKLYFVLAMSGALTACGGGGSGGEESSQPTNENPMGIWVGTLTDHKYDGSDDTCSPNPFKCEAILLVDDQATARLQADNGLIFKGSVNVTESDYTGYVNVFPESYIPSGTTLKISEVEGELTAEGHIDGSLYLLDGLARFEYSLDYDPQTKNGSDVAQLDGDYNDAAFSPAMVTTLNLSGGQLTGADDNLCNFSGTVQPLKSGYNLFRVSGLSISGCNNTGTRINGSYGGLATKLTLSDGYTYLVMNVNNSERFLGYKLRVQ